MRKMKKGCLFDLDGTLVDSLMDLALSTNRVLKKHGLLEHDISKYNHYVGNGVKKLMQRALGEEHQYLLDECLNDFQMIYDEHCLDHTAPYPRIREVIDELYHQGIKLAVVTNKPHHLAVKIVETLFPEHFTIVLGQQDIYPIKPAPDAVYMALMAMKLKKEDCIFIGDSDVDIDTGYYAQMDTIGVCWGFRGQEELEKAGADYIAFDADDILELIKK